MKKRKWTRKYYLQYLSKWNASPAGKKAQKKYKKTAKGKRTSAAGNLRTYGLPESQVQIALSTPKLRCAICGKRTDLCFDHKGGKFRGILCRIHNRNLGIFDKTVKEAKATIKYLSKWIRNRS